MKHPDIPMGDEAVSRDAGVYVSADGQVWQITNWFDDDGDECSAQEATRAVAGDGGCWFTLDLREFEHVVTQ